MLVSEEKEIALGLKSYNKILSGTKRSQNFQQASMVRGVGKRIAAVANRPDYQWEFNLIEDDKMVNAFALPGGKVAVYTGILPVTRDEAGLATVMSHEVAHALARHGGERMSTGLLAQFGMIALEQGLAGESPNRIMAFKTAYGVGAKVGFILPFSRKQELEADRIGLFLMAKAGYDPREAVHFWERMAQLDQSKAPEFLSTHPSDIKRIQQLKKWLPEAQRLFLSTR